MNQPAELMPQFSTIEYIVQVNNTCILYIYALTLGEEKILQDFHEALVNWKHISCSLLCARVVVATSPAS